jgi:hypothetical protein
MQDDKAKKLSNLTYRDFGRLAQDSGLSRYEKIGFYDKFREGKEELIFDELLRLLPALSGSSETIIDIGPGCSDLPGMLIEQCRRQQHRLVLFDNPEMLNLLPQETFIRKLPQEYPLEVPENIIEEFTGKAGAIICYSVFHYIFPVCPLHRFIDVSLALLKPGGQMLIGDIPNFDKKNRFFMSNEGIAFHRANSGDNSLPDTAHLTPHTDWIDDAAIQDILMRVRSSGSEAYLLPQHPDLPFAGRRDDILIVKR